MLLAFGMMSCEEADLTFDQGNAFVAFSGGSGSLSESSTESLTIEIYYASTSTGPVSVDVAFDASGIDNPAVEGEDFRVLSSKTVSFDSELVQLIEVEAIDNEVRDQNRSINITLTGDATIGMAGGMNGSFLLTIVDNEHPLANWIGEYVVTADSYGDVLNGEVDGAWDEEWAVTTSPVNGDETKLSLVGMAFGDVPVIASVDLDAMTITLPSGANTGEGYGNGPTVIWKGNYEVVEEVDVVGTINPDGTIAIDEVTLILPDFGNFIWDSFNTTWAPAVKKPAHVFSPPVDKMK